MEVVAQTPVLRVTVPQAISDSWRTVLGLPLERLITLPERMVGFSFDDAAELFDFSLIASNR
ncbi:MAG: hypothetical protein DYG94_01475 [Leptolyngbya sp. PLA3]|nr:hypothetical protein [Leptolyngbya sp. PL-A3]